MLIQYNLIVKASNYAIGIILTQIIYASSKYENVDTYDEL